MRRHLAVTDVVLVGFTTAAALTSVRTVPLFATVTAPVLATHLAALVPADRRAGAEPAGDESGSIVNVAMVAIVTFLALALTASKLSSGNVATETAKEYPVGATAWVRAHHPEGNLLNTFDWGGYLIWKLPEYPVSIDGRADLYTDELKTFGALLDGKGWPAIVARDHDGVAILPTDAGLTKAMAEDPGWQVAYRDQVATVLVRRT